MTKPPTINFSVEQSTIRRKEKVKQTHHELYMLGLKSAEDGERLCPECGERYTGNICQCKKTEML